MVRHAVSVQSRPSEPQPTVLVFHGTTLTRTASIFRAGRLRIDAPRLWPETARGAIYVSLQAREAADYARRALRPRVAQPSAYQCGGPPMPCVAS